MGCEYGPDQQQEAAGNRAADGKKRKQPKTPISDPATFSLVYESRDGKFCIFEDADGHLTSVRASRLA
jgi:hypothetical protein